MFISIYGISFFLLLFFSDHIPNKNHELQKLFSSSYTLIEYLFFTGFLMLALTNPKLRMIVFLFSSAFIIFQIFYYFTQPFRKLDTVPIGIETILLFIYIFLYFYQFLKNSLSEYVYNNPGFWISVGILIYLGGSFFINILSNHISQEQIHKYWFLTYIAEIIKNVLFAVALMLYLRQPDENTTRKVKIPNLDFSLPEQ